MMLRKEKAARMSPEAAQNFANVNDGAYVARFAIDRNRDGDYAHTNCRAD
jgi:hypothetical protein